MSNSQHFVVVGGGHAAGQLLDSLRREGFDGRLSLVTEEDMLPYQRPHLSKLYLASELPVDKLLYRPKEFYSRNDIECLTGTRVEAIEPSTCRLRFAGGDSLTYDKLALTTGARVRKLAMEGADAAGVHYLRGVADTDRIRDELADAQNVVLIGGGFLGLEAASVLTRMGKQTTVLEVQERVMANAVAPEVSTFYEKLHRDNGVRLLTSTKVSAIHVEDGRVQSVSSDAGEHYPADLLIISIGIVPNDELAKDAGLKCDDGIFVDDYARTGDENIVSAGDCTRHPNALLGRTLRLESVHNAVEQAKTAAASMMGRKKVYCQIPWFWSDQYNYRLQMTGIADAGDETVLRGSVDDENFSVLYFRDGKLSACNAVNRPADYMACRKVLSRGLQLTPAMANQEDFNLQSLVPKKPKLRFQKREKDLAALGA